VQGSSQQSNMSRVARDALRLNRSLHPTAFGVGGAAALNFTGANIAPNGCCSYNN
jgi:hypothetical protein